MQSHRVGCLSLLLGGCVLAAPVTAIAQGAPKPSAARSSSASLRTDLSEATKDDLSKAAKKAYDEGRYSDAEGMVRRILDAEEEKVKDVGTICNLGRVLFAQKKLEEAAQRLSYCLELAGSAMTEEDLQAMREMLAKASKDLGAMRVHVNVDGAQIVVDGEVRGTSPSQGDIFVPPGRHRVEARVYGAPAAQRDVQVEKGTSVPIVLSLGSSPIPAAPSPGELLVPPEPMPAPASVVRDSAPMRRSMWPVALGVGMATAGVVTGVAGFIQSAAYGGVADRLEPWLGDDTACGRNFNGTCSVHMNALVHSENAFRMGVAGTVIGSLAIVGTALYLIVPPSSDKNDTGLRGTAGIAPGGGYVLISGAF
jgi:hypothetical protein